METVPRWRLCCPRGNISSAGCNCAGPTKPSDMSSRTKRVGNICRDFFLAIPITIVYTSSPLALVQVEKPGRIGQVCTLPRAIGGTKMHRGTVFILAVVVSATLLVQ